MKMQYFILGVYQIVFSFVTLIYVKKALRCWET